MINTVFAHEGEAHENAGDSVAHYAEVSIDPFLAIILFITTLVVLWYVLGLLRVPKPTIALILVGVTFIIGIISMTLVPPLGLVSIALGFIGALFLAIGGIQESQHTK